MRTSPAPSLPTPEQCNVVARLPDHDGRPAFAIWYPQMGGYVARAVVLLEEDCFGAYVWHDGAFPFDEEYGQQPAYIHHCDPDQFISFGNAVNKMFEKAKALA